MSLRRGGLRLPAGNGHSLGTRCNCLARLLIVTPKECAKIGTLVVIRKLLFYMMSDRKLYQENFAYAVMICDCVHPREITWHCLDLATNVNVCMIVIFHLLPLPDMLH